MKRLALTLALLGSAFVPTTIPAHAQDKTESAPPPLDPATRDAVRKEWGAFVDRTAPVAERLVPLMVEPNDPLLRQELYRFIVSEMAMAYFGLFLGDAEHPDFWPALNQAFNAYGPNPDNYYFQAPIDGKGVYRISGFRGTSRIVDFQIGAGQWNITGSGLPVKGSINYDIDKLAIGKDGSFEVILSNERPAGHTGDWWQIPIESTSVRVRQIAYDWLHETDGRFTIERLDRPAARPRMTSAQIAQKLQQIPAWAENWTQVAMTQLRRDRDAGLINKVIVYDFAEEGGTKAQKYIKGQFDIQPDEALIMETSVPTCKYWSFTLNDLNYSVLDYTTHQVSLNGFQAKIDKDGKFRAVISEKDPGVANWLDTIGYRKGAILGRWRGCDGAPVPTLRKVKVAKVLKYLPADTAMVTPEAREATLRERSLGARLRRRW